MRLSNFIPLSQIFLSYPVYLLAKYNKVGKVYYLVYIYFLFKWDMKLNYAKITQQSSWSTQ